MIAMAQESSGFRCGWFAHPFALLIPAFALRFPPAALPVRLQRYTRTLPYPMWRLPHSRSFGGGLEPRDVVGAVALDQ
jgi:hypothetical protein